MKKKIIKFEGIIEDKTLKIPILDLFIKDAVKRAKKEVLDDIKRFKKKTVTGYDYIYINWKKFENIEKRHLSTFAKSKSDIIIAKSDKSSAEDLPSPETAVSASPSRSI